VLKNLSDERLSATAWIIGGLPLIISTLQAGNALSGRTALYWIPFIGDAARSLAELDVVVAAARLFYGQSSIIFALFLLIAAAWLTQGVLMFTEFGRNQSFSRTGTSGAVVLSGLLYGFLFLGVYSSLLTSGINPVQLAGFFLIPVVATGSLGGAYYNFSWEGSRRAEAVARLKDAEQTARTEQRRLENKLSQLPLERLESGSLDAVHDATQRKDSFIDECEGILSEINETIGNSETIEVQKLENQSQSLQQQANALDATPVVDDIDELLRAALDEIIDQRFGDITSKFISCYGEQYEVGNLPQKYRIIDVPSSDEVVTLSSADNAIADQLHNVIDRGSLSLQESIELMERVDNRIQNDVLPHLQAYEEDIQEIESQITEDFTRASEKINEIGGHTGNTLERLFISGTVGQETNSVTDIRGKLDQGKNELHKCRLENAINVAKTARSMSEEYMEAIRFVRSVLLPSIKRGEETISSVPSSGTREYGFFSTAVINTLKEPIRNDFGAEIHFDDSAQIITADYDIETTETGSSTTTQDPSSSSVKDAVKYLIREVQDNAGEGEVPDEATVSINALPESVQAADPAPELIDFIQSTDDLTISESPETESEDDDSSDKTPTTEGYISVKAKDDARLTRAVDGLIGDYRSWASKNDRGVL